MFANMLTLLLTFFYLLTYNDAENILAISHLPSRNHHILTSTIMNALSRRGHKVTMISPLSPNNDNNNYEYIELTEIVSSVEHAPPQKSFIKDNMSIIEKYTFAFSQIGHLEDLALNSTAIQTLLLSDRIFDLVFLVYAGNDALLGIANRFKAVSVLLSPMGSTTFINKVTGNEEPYSYVPNKYLPLTDTMNFWERLKNFMLNNAFNVYYDIARTSRQGYLLKKYFPDSPGIYQLRENVSLVLLNSHITTETARPLLPNMIQIGGIHIKDNELSEEYTNFMNTAKHGVILFALGSKAKSSDLPPQTIDSIMSTFAKLPQRVLWKFEAEQNFKSIPANVKVSKWLPQSAILAHPNLKLFVTHGGSLSMIEAVYNGVPMVVIPIIGDQQSNACYAVSRGYGVKLDLVTLTRESFTEAIKEVLNNPRYRVQIKTASLIMRDQPIKPLDNAIYWIEYVMRHNGAHHLKSAGIKLTWYQFYLLDVLGFIILMLIAVLYILYSVCKALKRMFLTYKLNTTRKNSILHKSKIN